jgi:8-oxo-dGTP pyrophosphatase MutT (NUDIX family)
MRVDSFDILIEKLANRLKQPLPGARAHDLMRAIPVGNSLPKFEHKTPPKPGSVLILLYPTKESIYFPLIQRPIYTGAHSGQVSLPGGKAETGEDSITTALREGREEIGIDPSTITVIGQLSEFFVIPSNFLIRPVVAWTKSQPTLIPDSFEVERILYGNITELIREDAIKTKEIIAAGKFNMMAPHFEIDSQIVWGATAMMLNELRMLVRELSH